MTSCLTFVMPCFNEGNALPQALTEFFARVDCALSEEDIRWEVLLIDDGSTDQTWQRIVEWAEKRPELRGIRLMRNAGQQAALLCGYQYAHGDWILTLDADLQDPPELSAEMLRLGRKGYDIVIARRASRAPDPWLKRLTASGFYTWMWILGMDPHGMQAGEFRMLSRSAAERLTARSRLPLFHRLLVLQLDLPIANLDYDRASRVAGTTKYTYAKMIKLAVEAMWSTPISRRRLLLWQVALQCLLVLAGWIVVRNTQGSRWVIAGLAVVAIVALAAYLLPTVFFWWQRVSGRSFYTIAEEIGGTEASG